MVEAGLVHGVYFMSGAVPRGAELHDAIVTFLAKRLAAPAGQRGEVMSAYYLLAYGALSVPTILAGWAATTWGLAAVFPWFTAAVALACILAGTLGLRSTRTAVP